MDEEADIRIVDCCACHKKFDIEEDGLECNDCDRCLCPACRDACEGFYHTRVPNPHGGGEIDLFICPCGNYLY